MTHTRVRVSRIQLAVEAFADDGELLRPLQVDPLSVPMSQIGQIEDLILDAIRRWETAINQEGNAAKEAQDGNIVR